MMSFFADLITPIVYIAILIALLISIYLILLFIRNGDKVYKDRLRKHLAREERISLEIDKSSPSTSSKNGETIRDFIYVDNDRLYSFYSQAFEGVADRVVQSYIELLTSQNTQSSTGQSGSLEARIAEASLKTESKFLYDHMYNLLEAQIGSRIVQIENVNRDNYLEKIGATSLIRVTGSAEIEDYQRMREFLGRFNEVADAIAYSVLTTEETKQKLKEAEEVIKNIPDPNKRVIPQKKFENMKDVKRIATEMHLRLDDQLLKNLEVFTDLFYSQGFDVTITVPEAPEVVYRGVLDHRWLRIQPNILRALYGTLVKGKWTLIGQPTYIPGFSQTAEEARSAGINASPPSKPSMKDPFRNMFNSQRAFETMFQESVQRVEIIIAPLAIYHEIEIPKVN